MTGVWAVVSGQCDPPSLLPTASCEPAPEICLQGACYETLNNGTNDPHSEWCGNNTAVHNPQYFAFVATSTTVQISIQVGQCSGGGGCGLQSAILDACDWNNSNVLSCDPGTNTGGTMILSSNAMQIDSMYWLLIDGCAGALCDYTINFVSGTYEPQISGDLTDASSEPSACQGQDSWIASASPPLPDAAGYLWQGFPWGDETSTLADLDISIPETAPPGTYTICVRAFTGCDTTDTPQCFDFDIYEIDDWMSAPVELCAEEFAAGYPWNGLTITGPGQYTQTFNTPEGCPYDSIIDVSALPVPDVGEVNHVECAQNYTYEGMLYEAAGSYDLSYPNASAYGCDSMAVLNLDLAYVEAEATFECDLGEYILTAFTPVVIPSSANLMYQWYDDAGNPIGDLDEIVVTEPGTYHLDLSIDIDGTVCTYTATPVNVDLDGLLPPKPTLVEADSVVCQFDMPTYAIADEIDILDYFWEAPGDATIFGQGTTEIQIDWNQSAGGEVCIHMMNDCGEGPMTCFFVQVLQAPEPLFDMPSSTCVNSNVIVEFSGNASGDALYFWDFDNATIVGGGGNSPGPHELTWGNPGTYDVTLKVVEPGCEDTAYVQESIFVETLGTPVVNCNSTVSSIEFSWNPVTGANSYSVNVLTSHSGTLQGDSAFVVTGLSDGEMVTIEVIASGTGPCPDRVTEVTCSAQNCTAPTSEIANPGPLCLGDVSGAIPLEATVEGAPATGTWSGPGIVDADNGLFDPNAPGAGPGQHQVVFSFMQGGCTFSTSTDITVYATPTADFSAVDEECINSMVTVSYSGSATTGASYTWSFDGGQVMSGAGPGPYEIMWNTAGTKEIALTVEQNGCVSEEFTHEVTLSRALTHPTLQCATSTSTITFTWNDVPDNNGYTLNVLEGPSGTRTGNQYDVGGLTPGDSVMIELITMGDGICPNVRDTITCYAQDCPVPTISLFPSDTALCLYPGTGTIDFEAVVTGGGGTGTWSGPGITDPANGIFDPMAATAGPGTHVITYNYTDQGCPFSRQATVRIDNPPVAAVANSAFILTCENNNELTLDASPSTPAGSLQYVWSTSEGILLTDPGMAQVTAGGAGDYQLLVINTATGCRDSTTVTLQRDAAAPTADAGEDGILDCNVMTFELGGSSTSTGPDIHHFWSTSDGNFMSDPNAPTVTVDAPGTYNLMVVDSSNGCVDQDQAVIDLDRTPPTPTVDVSDMLTCDVTSVDLKSMVLQGSGNYTYTWSTPNGVIQGPTNGANVVATSAGFFKLVVTDQQTGCQDSIEVEVLADDDVVEGVDFVIEYPDCFGDQDGSVTIVNVIGGSAPFTYTWSNGATTEEITNLAGGSYTLELVDANGCRFTRTFDLPIPVLLTADIGSDIVANINDDVTITLVTSIGAGAIDTVIWNGPFPDCFNCMEVTFSAQESGSVLATVIDTNGCRTSASLNLTVIVPINVFAPNVFSPNGDGANDYFTIYGNTLVEVTEFQVFDRWGELVHELPGFLQGEPAWNGQVNGEDVNPGVYVYRAQLVHDTGLVEYVIGDITLVR